jgi:hypothetical protein
MIRVILETALVNLLTFDLKETEGGQFERFGLQNYVSTFDNNFLL